MLQRRLAKSRLFEAPIFDAEAPRALPWLIISASLNFDDRMRGQEGIQFSLGFTRPMNRNVKRSIRHQLTATFRWMRSIIT